MGYLKLIKENHTKVGDLESLLKSRDWTEQEKALLRQIDQYAEFFKMKIANPAVKEDFSKHFLIFSVNYFELGLNDQAKEMLNLVQPNYFRGQMMKDMEEAVDHRNKADEWERKRQFGKAQQHKIEAEFFLVVMKILPHLQKEESINTQDYFLDFLSQLQNKTFTIKISPSLELLDNDENGEEEQEKSTL